MLNHSSIFSSKELRTLLGLLLLLLCIAIWACHIPGARIKVVSTRLGKSIDMLRSNLYSADKKDQSLILFFGNSRFMSCIDAHHFESRLDTPKVTCVNMAQESMAPWQYNVVLREVDRSLQSVKVAFIEMDPWMFNANGRHPITYKHVPYPIEYDIYATLQERLLMPGWFNKTKLLYDYFPRYSLKEIYAAIRYSSPTAEHPIPFVPPSYHSDTNIAKVQRSDPNFFPLNISRMHMNDYQFCPYWQMALERLLSRLSLADIPVILVHPPVKSDYYKYVESDAKRFAQYNRLLAYIDELKERYPFLYYRTSSDCGLDDNIFIDYGHFTKEGAIPFTDVLYDATREWIANILR